MSKELFDPPGITQSDLVRETNDRAYQQYRKAWEDGPQPLPRFTRRKHPGVTELNISHCTREGNRISAWLSFHLLWSDHPEEFVQGTVDERGDSTPPVCTITRICRAWDHKESARRGSEQYCVLWMQCLIAIMTKHGMTLADWGGRCQRLDDRITLLSTRGSGVSWAPSFSLYQNHAA